MCKPQHKITMSLNSKIIEILNNRESMNQFIKDYRVYMTLVRATQTVEIAGSELNVTLVRSIIETEEEGETLKSKEPKVIDKNEALEDLGNYVLDEDGDDYAILDSLHNMNPFKYLFPIPFYY